MSDNDSDAGSEAPSGAGSAFDVDPSKLIENMSEKEKKAWDKGAKKWRLFMDFLLRHVAIVTFKYNTFEQEEMTAFLQAMEKAEYLRATVPDVTKKKKKKLRKRKVTPVTPKDPRVKTYKDMQTAADLLQAHRFYAESHRLRFVMDLTGRLRGLNMIAKGFFKALKKCKVPGIDKFKHYLDYWRGFTIRTYDYTEVKMKGIDPDEYNIWPATIRTAIYLAQKFLKLSSDNTGLQLMTEDPKVLRQHMTAADFTVAQRIEDLLAKKVVSESQNFVLGAQSLLGLAPKKPEDEKKEIVDPTELENIDPELLRPIPDYGLLCELPEEVPKEKKKKKKGKKGKGKGKGRGMFSSAKKKKKK
ncbi:unnamed protein product [Owenia fusiformis]|nr:unnamed protein product [Owenia fusiformis]